MNKGELVAIVAEKSGITKKEAATAVETVFESISDALVKKDKVQMIGFGTFETRERAARTGRNPQTGQEIKIAASVIPAFKPGKALKEAVNAPKKGKKK